MDKHYLTPLFSPESILVFAPPGETPQQHSTLAHTLADNIKAQGFKGGLYRANVIDPAEVKSMCARIAAELGLGPDELDAVPTQLEIARYEAADDGADLAAYNAMFASLAERDDRG